MNPPLPEDIRDAADTSAIVQLVLTERGWGEITTEVAPVPAYYYAENYHQQYLAKNPDGYRCHSATGAKVPR